MQKSVLIPLRLLAQSFADADTRLSCFSQIHYLLNLGAEINQRDDKGFTPLHRAAYLAQYDGYMEIYEYLMVSWFRFYVISFLICIIGQPECAKAGC